MIKETSRLIVDSGLSLIVPLGHIRAAFGSTRKAGARVGRFESTVSDQYVPYIVPQEHGQKTDVRWLGLHDLSGAGLDVSGAPLLQFSALHYSANDLFAAPHSHQIPWRDSTLLCLDIQQRGLGTASCGPDTLPRYRLRAGTHRFAYTLSTRRGPRRP